MTASAVTTTQTASDTELESGDEATPLTAQLFLVLESARPRAGGARYSLTKTDEVVIGRGERRSFSREGAPGVARLQLSVPSPTLSSAHARLRNHRGHWSLQDLGSTNGTYLNGVKVRDAVLRDRDVVEMGQAFFVFREGLPTPRHALTEDDLASDEGALGPRTLLPQEAERLRLLVSISRTKLPVLLLGETGTGKEVLARAVHRLSARPGALVAVNCGALNNGLLDSQLFGHGRGSFSGATRDEPGLVRAADRGTLLLDEVGDMSPAAQVALLRVLQESEVLPVGAAKPIPVDVRVIAATHQPLSQLVAAGAFRADLLARLYGHAHALPNLRQRREDLGVLLADLLHQLDPEQRLQRLSPEVGRAMLVSPWPMNIRQLTQALTRALALVEDGVLRSRDWEPLAAGPTPSASAEVARPVVSETRWSADEEQLRERLLGLLSAERGNVTEVAKNLGKARMQVQRWMKRFGLDPAVYRH